jgi:hypothetical protein
MTRRLIRALTAVVCVMVPSAAQAQGPVVRVNIRQAPPLLVGQEVRIDVQVLVPNFFMSPLRMPQLDVPGAVVRLPDESAVNLNETIGGAAYAGIQRTYVFVAQAAGTFTLPPAVITFTYAAEPGKPAEGRVTIPPTDIVVAWPAGMAPPPESAGMIVGRVTITQELDRDPAALRAGDALTRTITTTAERTQPMFIPPPEFTAPDGVRVYIKDPGLTEQLDDRSRTLIAGRRVDRVVYTFERPGTFALPGIKVPWFDLQARRQESARAEAVTVTVAASATTEAIAPEAPQPDAPAPPPAPRWPRLVATAAGVLAALALAFGVIVRASGSIAAALGLIPRAWHALTRDRAHHLPPLNPVERTTQ